MICVSVPRVVCVVTVCPRSAFWRFWALGQFCNRDKSPKGGEQRKDTAVPDAVVFITMLSLLWAAVPLGNLPGCYTGDGTCYRGGVSTTSSGKTCQEWSLDSPHSHNYNSIGEHNYCRNPDGDTSPWCYTTDSGTRFEHCAVPVCTSPPPSPPPLAAGDCMVVGVHADSPDTVAILLLADMGPGDEIKVTDTSWYSYGAFSSSSSWSDDSHVTVAADSSCGETAGTVLTVSGMSLSSSSYTDDNILVYTGSTSSPTFICALAYKTGGFSTVPPGLTEGVDAIELAHYDNMAYTGTTTGAFPRTARARASKAARVGRSLALRRRCTLSPCTLRTHPRRLATRGHPHVSSCHAHLHAMRLPCPRFWLQARW